MGYCSGGSSGQPCTHNSPCVSSGSQNQSPAQRQHESFGYLPRTRRTSGTPTAPPDASEQQ